MDIGRGDLEERLEYRVSNVEHGGVDGESRSGVFSPNGIPDSGNIV